MKECENCKKEHDGSYGSGRFCSCRCARSFSSKEKREEINKKVSLTLKTRFGDPVLGKYEKKVCPECHKEFITKRRRQCCSRECASFYRWKNPSYLEKITEINKKRASSIEERERLRDIGRKGGFGKKGYTKEGTYFQSSFEEKCFSLLEDKNIKYNPHKNIPNSSRVSDVYLINQDIWIELDGINREKKKEWLGKEYDRWLEKLELYKNLNINVHIIYTYEDFKIFIESL